MTKTVIEIKDFTENYKKPLKIHTNHKHKRYPEKISITLADYYDSQDKKQLVVKNKEQLINFLEDLGNKYGVKVVEYEDTKYKIVPIEAIRKTPTKAPKTPIPKVCNNFPTSESYEVKFL
jgi:capsule polysaccharide export protein KpsE/RkpR